MDTEFQALLVKLILVMIPLLLGLAVYSVRPLIKALIERVEEQIGAEKYAMLLTWAYQLVETAEQTIDDNVDKKEYVINTLQKLAQDNGIEVTYEQLDILIESSVYQIKKSIASTNAIST